MSGKKESLTRRNFMVASTAAVAAPLLADVADVVPEAKAEKARTSERAKAAEKSYTFAEQKSCDLVVLGGGGSGLVAAVRAAQQSGKKVIVLEKDTEAGGGGRGARTVRIFGSKWQAKRNIKDTMAEYAHEKMNSLNWWLDEKVVHNCLRGTGQFFDWLCEEGGDIEDKFIPGKYVFAHGDYEPTSPQHSTFGLFVVNLMKEKAQKYGVEILTGHPVVDVEVKDGKIVAAVAKSDKGYVRVACKACVLATGSWVSNEAICKKYAPQFFELFCANKMAGPAGGGAAGGQGGQSGQAAQGGAPGGQGHGPSHMSPNYTGDGIPLAEKVGAFVDYDSFVTRPMGPTVSSPSTVCTAISQTPFVVTVSRKGQRFACESVIMNLGFFAGGGLLLKVGGAGYDIFNDDAIAAAFAYQKLPESEKKPVLDVDLVPGYKVRFPETMEKVQSDLKKNLANIVHADTLEELADQLNVDRASLVAVIKKYNEGCAAGDDEFFKSKEFLVPLTHGPYYACRAGMGTDGAFGGVRVNPEMQAYKADRVNLVEGFYVTGDFATGRHVNVRGLKWQVLNDISWAISSGFLAGTNVAAYLQKLG